MAVSNSDLINIHTLVVAAGKGARFGSKAPKQYTFVLGKTILEHTVTALSKCESINNINLVIAKDDEKAGELDFDLPVNFIEGGAERWQSVQLGVEAIFKNGCKLNDLILIHDAARPCVQKHNIDAVLESAKVEPYGAILGVPVADTLKKIGEDNRIIETLDRRQLWQAQTPQVFRAGKLREVLQQISLKNIMITDEASAFETMGLPIKIVKGNKQNLKLTYNDDLLLIESILLNRDKS